MIEFRCPHCGAERDLPDDFAGDTIACPACHRPGDVSGPVKRAARRFAQRGPVFIDHPGIKVTRSRVEFSDASYAVAQISSVSRDFLPHDRSTGLLLAVLLGVCAACGLFLAVLAAFLDGAAATVLGFLALAAGAGAFAVWHAAVNGRDRHTVLFKTRGETIEAISTSDRRLADDVEDALNDAIEARG